MAGGQERILRRRIRSVQNTMKITRAMELIAASRIVKAQQAIAAARPYVERMAEVVADLANTPEGRRHPLFRQPEAGAAERSAIIIVGGDRGLSGAYNSTAIRTGEELIGRSRQRPLLIAAGRRVESYFRYRDRQPDAVVSGHADRPLYEDAQAVVAPVIKAFRDGSVDEVHLVYWRFVTSGSQQIASRRLIPLDLSKERGDRGQNDQPQGLPVAYEYEPDPDAILDALLPQWLEAEVYAAMLDAAASFHAAQQRAMKAATDNAEDLITNFTRIMNRARQETITTEIMEIVGGAEALRGGAKDDGNHADTYESSHAG
jgi:F-type H+-transporting ATPase subunit gamma